jgi:hypothetical protein
MAERFRRKADSLAFDSGLKRRIEAALAAMPGDSLGRFWRRFAWPSAIAAALALAAGLSLFRPMPARAFISVRLSYSNPTYTFFREKNLVVDALTCTPQIVKEDLPVPQTQQRKTSL